MNTKRKPIEDRFWPRVHVPGIGFLVTPVRIGLALALYPTACWEWRGSRTGIPGYQYGSIYWNGRHWRAHRVAWILFHGRDFPLDRDACHSCDNPPCVNPLHIWPGTKSENSRDAVRKGRVRGPGLTGNAKRLAEATHCKRGHPFDEYRNARGRRRCLICQRNQDHRYANRDSPLLVGL